MDFPKIDLPESMYYFSSSPFIVTLFSHYRRKTYVSSITDLTVEKCYVIENLQDTKQRISNTGAGVENDNGLLQLR